MFTAEDYRTFMKEGSLLRELNVGGIVFKVRLLSTQDVLLSDMVVDYLASTAKSWTSPLQVSLDTLVRLAFIVEEVDGKRLEPALSKEAKEKVLDSLLGLSGEEEKLNFVRDYVKPRIAKLLNFPPAVIEALVSKYTELREEVRKFIESEGGLPNS